MPTRSHEPYTQKRNHEKGIVRILELASLTTLLAGCAWQVGSGPKQVTMQPAVRQQLIDLQRAKDAVAITDSEYQAQKAKLLENN